MKALIIAAAMIFIVPINAYCSLINIISATHNVSGWIEGYGDSYDGYVSEGYSTTTHTTAASGTPYATGYIGNYEDLGSESNTAFLHVETEAYAYGWWNSSSSEALASSSYIFTPTSNLLAMHYYGEATLAHPFSWSYTSISLFDMTASESLLNALFVADDAVGPEAGWPSGWPSEWEDYLADGWSYGWFEYTNWGVDFDDYFYFNADLSHEYKLSISSGSYAERDTWTWGDISVAFEPGLEPIPEPATILLFGAGLVV